jgi:hypothetical protein
MHVRPFEHSLALHLVGVVTVERQRVNLFNRTAGRQGKK